MSADATVHCQSRCRLRQRNVCNCCVARPCVWIRSPKSSMVVPGWVATVFRYQLKFSYFIIQLIFSWIYHIFPFFQRWRWFLFPHLLFFLKGSLDRSRTVHAADHRCPGRQLWRSWDLLRAPHRCRGTGQCVASLVSWSNAGGSGGVKRCWQGVVSRGWLGICSM